MFIKLPKSAEEKLKAVAEEAAKYSGRHIFLKPKDVFDYTAAYFATLDTLSREKEYFLSFGLDTRNKIKFMDIVSIGTLNFSVVHPREVFRAAVVAGCASLVISHNHPSGSVEPSEEDIRLTKRLVEAGKILGIEVLDHVVTAPGTGKHFSFKENGLL